MSFYVYIQVDSWQACYILKLVFAAPLYGDSEDRLGHALGASPLGSQALIYTKAGKLVRRLCGNRQVALLGPQPWAPWAVPVGERCLLPDFSAAGAKKSYTESCERMGVSSVHTLRIHDPDSIEGAWDQAVGNYAHTQWVACWGRSNFTCCLCGGNSAGRPYRWHRTAQSRRAHHRRVSRYRLWRVYICHRNPAIDPRFSVACAFVGVGMNANAGHKVITPGAGGVETTDWTPDVIIDLIRAVPANTIDSALLAYSWNLFTQDGWPVLEECDLKSIF